MRKKINPLTKKTYKEERKERREKERKVRNQKKQPKQEEEEEYDDISLFNPAKNNDFFDDPYEEKEERKRSIPFSSIFISVLCVYFVFLIYGVLMTNYSFQSDGKIHPNVLSIQEIGDKDEYQEVLNMYLNCRKLYEDILLLDYRVEQADATEYPQIGIEYSEKLEIVKKLTIRIAAIQNTKYTQIDQMMANFIDSQYSISTYCQKMSNYLSNGNESAAKDAISIRSEIYTDFAKLTSNMVLVGAKLKGVDVSEIRKWSPESYIDQKIKGKE